MDTTNQTTNGASKVVVKRTRVMSRSRNSAKNSTINKLKVSPKVSHNKNLIMKTNQSLKRQRNNQICYSKIQTKASLAMLVRMEMRIKISSMENLKSIVYEFRLIKFKI